MPRAVFVFTPDARGLVERRVDGERLDTLGRVEDAPYLRVQQPAWLARAFAWLLGPARTELQLVPPFDEAGGDALRLVDARTPVLDGHDDPIGEVRRVSGTVVCLSPREPGDEIVVRDLWLGSTARVVDGAHFGVEAPDGERIVVAFARAPLVIARPTERDWGTHRDAVLPHLPSGARGRLTDLAEGSSRGSVVEIREGDRVEVVGLGWAPEAAEQRFDLRDRSLGYRDAPRPPRLVLGDAPGLRMVIRRL